jgi:asparagine synthase (glutamine-hydrolysing)
MQDVLQYSTPNLLRYEDKNSMAFSIESRVPFLDHKLVEYIFNLPIDQKIKNGWNRYVYRTALKGHMPDKNRLRRSKIGFTNPELSWMRIKRETILGIFSSPAFVDRGLFDAKKVQEKFSAWAENGSTKFSGDPLIFWRLLCTELWIERMIEGRELNF